MGFSEVNSLCYNATANKVKQRESDALKKPQIGISQCEMPPASLGGGNKSVSAAGVNPPLKYTLSCTMLHRSIVTRACACAAYAPVEHK